MIKKENGYGEISAQELFLDEYEIAARLHTCVGYSSELLEHTEAKVREAIDCRYCFCRVSVKANDGRADLGFGEIETHDLCAALSGCEEAYVFAVTIGHGADRLVARLSATSAAEGFVADAVASAYAEAAADLAEKKIKGDADCRPRFSVGYGDLPLTVQAPLLDFLSAGKLLGVTLGKSLLMSPKKTITAIMGIKK